MNEPIEWEAELEALKRDHTDYLSTVCPPLPYPLERYLATRVDQQSELKSIIASKLHECREHAKQDNEYRVELEAENSRLKEALRKIATRKMSMYLSSEQMLIDFIITANEALKEEPK